MHIYQISPLDQSRRQLAMERPMMSLIDKDMLALSDEIVLERENWVDALVDRGRSISFDGGKTSAFLGISVHYGTKFWLVCRDDKRFGYHAEQSDPLAAVEEAHQAWLGRKAVRADWDSVEKVARDLIIGRMKFDVLIEDAFASPLCSLGVREFLRKHRLQNVRRVSGRFAALLMKFDQQVGFVIHQAHQRHMEIGH